MAETYTANIEVRDIPTDTNRIIDTLCKLRGKHKWQLIREAMIEYANAHREDIVRLAGADRARK